MSLLDACTREQSTIQERNSAKRARRGRSTPLGCVECAKKQRAQYTFVKPSAFRGALLELSLEKGAVFVEPAFRLEEGEKKQSRRVEQRDLAAHARGRSRRRRRNRMDGALESAIKPYAQRLASENLDPARVRDDVAIAAGSVERSKCFSVAVDDAPSIDEQGRDAWRPAVAIPCTECNDVRRRLQQDNHPQHVWRARGQTCGDARKRLTQRLIPGYHE
jgi:hypothetical protein